MQCPKCGSPLRASNQKKGYFLCDTCKIRMSQVYVEKTQKTISPNTTTKKKNNTTKKWKALIVLMLFISIAGGCFLYFDLWEKFNHMIHPSEQINIVNDSVSIDLISYETISDGLAQSPLSGHEYLILSLQFTNNHSEELLINEMYHFELYVDDAKLSYFPASSQILTFLGNEPLNKTCSPGETISGTLCFEVPVTWENATLFYSPEIWSSSTIAITLKNTN